MPDMPIVAQFVGGPLHGTCRSLPSREFEYKVPMLDYPITARQLSDLDPPDRVMNHVGVYQVGNRLGPVHFQYRFMGVAHV